MTAEDIITALTQGNSCPRWIQQAATLADPPRYGGGYETTAVNFFPEVTVRVEAEKTAKRSGKTYLGQQRRRIDLVALVQPHYKQYQPFIAGVEIKVAEHDLANDSKLAAYLNYCHLFYLAVPAGLLTPARQKIDRTPALTGCGLLAITGNVVEIDRDPHLRRPTSRNLAEIYAELLIRPFKVAKKSRKLFIEFG